MITTTIQTEVAYSYQILEVEQLPNEEATFTIIEDNILTVEQAIICYENIEPRENCANIIKLVYTLSNFGS